jgi:hypothetical protein
LCFLLSQALDCGPPTYTPPAHLGL